MHFDACDSNLGYVCIIGVKDSFYTPVWNHKLYRLDTCTWRGGDNNFQNFPLTHSTELINSYRINNYKSVAIFCREKLFKKYKWHGKEDYNLHKEYDFLFTKEELEKLEVFLTQMEFELIELINDEIHMKDENKKKAEWVKNLVLKRNEYAQSSSYKKFIIRHENKFSAMKWLIPRSFLIGLIFFPLVIMIAEAFGAEHSWYYPTSIYLLFYFYTLWIEGYQDQQDREKIFRNEKSVIRDRLSRWH